MGRKTPSHNLRKSTERIELKRNLISSTAPRSALRRTGQVGRGTDFTPIFGSTAPFRTPHSTLESALRQKDGGQVGQPFDSLHPHRAGKSFAQGAQLRCGDKTFVPSGRFPE